ncbi:unnamed protein product [Phaedon cochleariae]|uniref:Serpin domain-containing protein n=1 Tax=Phaedon cochleariae TaxID=80249 RepID=A0A9P0DK78_PHACE|nr:unnamed protein product [Phaedon cochleariae]
MRLLIIVLVLGLVCHASKVNDGNDDAYFPAFGFSDSFDWTLFKEFATQNRNVLLSPVSLKVILALLYQGSSEGTAREFQSVLQFGDKKTVLEHYGRMLTSLQDSERTEYLLNLGTAIFLDKQIKTKPYFDQISKDYFRTLIKPTNFSNTENASRNINRWVRNLTHGKVSQLVSPDDLTQTIMLITNAVYFKGTWTHKFPKNQTFTGKFYYSDDYRDKSKLITVNVPFMSTTDEFFFQESSSLDAKVLRLPYKGSSYSMFFILPNSLGGLPELMKKIHLGTISELLYSLDKRVVEVNIPKFKFNFLAKLADTLKEFGLHQMFQNTASFTGIVEWNSTLLRQLVVSDIIQKCGIEVDEQGSVVYSATDVNIGNKFGEANDVFNATHPFLFFIEGPNGTVLFIGKVENPLEEEQIPLPSRWGNIQNKIDESQPANAQNVQSMPEMTVEEIRPEQNDETSGSSPNLSPNLSPSSDSDYVSEDVTKDEIADRFNLFDIELLNAFTDTTTNVFISPASIKTTLAMILEGAAGNCANEISEALRIPDINRKGVRDILLGLLNNMNERGEKTSIESYNAIFTSDQHTILEKYRDAVRQFYGVVFKTVDFNKIASAVEKINQWVSDSTHGAITEIVSPQTLSTKSKVVIANALHFKGAWQNAFDINNTVTKCFHTAKGCVSAPMMHVSEEFNYNYISSLRAHAVELPYQGKFSMLILLPAEDANIRTVIRDLPHFRLSEILHKLKSTDIVLEIPKFAFEYSADMVEYLGMLKVKEIFGSNANLSGIIEGGNVLVNNLVHKTKIEVDEDGTVAAASTSAIIIPLMGSLSVIADRPFVFIIYHKESQNIIFEGVLRNPVEQSPTYNVRIDDVPASLKQQMTFRSRQFNF